MVQTSSKRIVPFWRPSARQLIPFPSSRLVIARLVIRVVSICWPMRSPFTVLNVTRLPIGLLKTSAISQLIEEIWLNVRCSFTFSCFKEVNLRTKPSVFVSHKQAYSLQQDKTTWKLSEICSEVIALR